MKILTQLEPDKFVGVCRRDALHVGWAGVVLRLRPDDFEEAVCLLEAGITDVSFARIEGDNRWLKQQETGHYLVGLGDIMLALSLMDFLNFADMVRSAKRQANSIAVGRG